MYNYCKTCCHDDGDVGFCDKCYYNHILEEKGIPPTEYEANTKPITNADRIRAMSDEELAEFMCHNVSNGTVNCAFCAAAEFCRMGHNGWLDWLREEVTDG